MPQQQPQQLDVVEEIDAALGKLENIVGARRALDKLLVAQRHDIARIQDRLSRLADALEGEGARA
jgi:hypothetical protein